LIAVYAIERQDDQTVMSGHLALLAGAIALLGALGFVLLRGSETPGWIFALLPVAPLPLFGLDCLLIASGDLRHRFIEALEERLAELIDVEVAGAPVPSHHRVAYGVWRGAGRAIVAFLAVFGSLGVLYTVLLVQSARRAANAHAEAAGLASATACGLIALLLVAFVAEQQLRASRLWEKRLEAVKREARKRCDERALVTRP
jgi:hypothetical protein